MEILTTSTWLGGILGLLVMLYRPIRELFFTVEEGHIAVIESFGRVIFDNKASKALKTFGPGLHWKYPWQDVKTVSLMDQFWDLETDKNNATTMAYDGTALKIKSALRFKISRTELYHYLYGLARPEEHVKGLFVALLKDKIARFRGGDREHEKQLDSSYAHIRQERAVLHKRMSSTFGQKLQNSYGIAFDAIDLVDILPPEELAEALNAVLNAKAETETNFARGQAECANRVLAAEEGVRIATDQAKAHEIEIMTIGEKLIELENAGTLVMYVDRRKSEVFNDCKNVFVRK